MITSLRKLLIVPIVAVALFASSANAATSYKVTKVVDGDTIQVQIGAKIEKIRMIGVDTPETVDPRKPVQCFGKEASAKTKQLLQGKSVALEVDKSQGDKDKYGRLLRYVILNGVNINKQLIAEGYAHEYTYTIPYKYQSAFKQAQKAAQTAQKGLWSPKTCNTKAAAITSVGEPAVKKSTNNLCHAKGTKYYVQTKTFTAYKTVQACLASGGKMPK